MSPRRAFYIMCGTVALLFCLIIGATVAGDLWLQKQSKKLMSIKLDNRLIDEQQIAVVQANKDIQKYADLEKIANTIVPQDKDQAKTVREIVSIAQKNNIPISSIAFPSSTLGSSSAPSSSAATTGGTSAATSGTAATSSSASTTPSITQVTPVQGMTGVYQMLITIQSNSTKPIPYSSFIGFLEDLEANRHTAQVGTMNIVPYSKDISKLSFTLGINVYIRP